MRQDSTGLAMRVIDDVRDAAAERALDIGKRRLPDLSFEGISVRAARGGELLTRVDAIDRAELPEALALTLDVARARVCMWAREADWYWTVFDPSGHELFAMFAATPYCGGFIAAGVSGTLARLPLAGEGDRLRYLAGLADYGRLIHQLADRTEGQAERGILMPRAQAEAAGPLLDRLIAEQPVALAIPADAEVDGEFRKDVDDAIAVHVVPAWQRLRSLHDEAYITRCGDAVGLAQYPDGDTIYAALVQHHAATDLSPAEVHSIGQARVATIRAAMAEARQEAGFSGTDTEWRAALDADPAWRAEGAESLTERFQTYIDRADTLLERHFNVKPKATHGVRPLPEALTASMTFGYYDGPRPDRPHGDYVFNAANLGRSSLVTLGALTFHELIPGHHLHLALQRENMALPLLRRDSLPTAYTEGWAEYAATFAGEQGLYASPEERFGRLVSEAFLACRLVVDTGMNALGWSLQQARDYMAENSFFPATEIASETLRYGSDIPGQALAYKLGEFALAEMRDRMRAARGDGFAPSEFHDLVLEAGAVPLPSLARLVEERLAS